MFRSGLTGVDLDRLASLARDLVEERPRTMKELREELLPLWPDADPGHSPSPPGAGCHWSRSPRAGSGGAAGRWP